MSRIADCFERLAHRGEGALIPYLMAGDPDLERSYRYAQALIAGGADLIELGVPFSDPVADGPTIQAAGSRALNSGTHLDEVFKLVSRLRTESEIPLILMSYYNPIFRLGQGLFLKRCLDEGVSGAIIPDLPIEEAGSYLELARRYRVDTVFIATPETGDERLARISAQTGGFLYLVSRYGTTGAQDRLDPRTEQLIAQVRSRLPAELPLGVGFGLSLPEQISAVIRAGAQGAIVGSALVQRVAQGRPPEELAQFIRELKGGTRLLQQKVGGWQPEAETSI